MLSRVVAMACTGVLVIGSTGGDVHAAVQQEGPPYFAPVAGTGEAGDSGDGQAAADAAIGPDPDIAVGQDGTLYLGVGDRVRAVDRDGMITTVPGTEPAANGVAVGPDGTLYVAGDKTVRQVAPDGSVTWTANVDIEALDDSSVAVDGGGTVYLAGKGIIVRIGRDGTARTIGGGGTLDPIAAEGKPATEANLGDLSLDGLAVDAGGAVYLTVPSSVLPSTSSGRLLRIDQDGTLHTAAGAGEDGFSGDGGPAPQAEVGGVLTNPTVDGDGNVYFFDLENFLIRVVGGDGVIDSLAALPPVPGEAAEELADLAAGPGGELYVSANSVVYQLKRDGRSWTAGPARESDYPPRFPDAEPGDVHTVAGTGSPAKDGAPTARELGRPAAEVPLSRPGNYQASTRRVAVDHDGTLLVADSDMGSFAVTMDGRFDEPFAPHHTPRVWNYWVSMSGLWPAEAVAVGPDGSRYVAVRDVVYHLAPGEQPMPVAGRAEERIFHDQIEEGRPATLSQFGGISDLAVGPDGKLHIATLGGVYRLDGDGTLAKVFRRSHHQVQAVTVDAEGRVYVATLENSSGLTGYLYRVDPGAKPRVVAGTERSDVDFEDGANAADVVLGAPSDVVVDDGTVYLATAGKVVRVDTDGTILTVVDDGTPTALALDRHGDLYFVDDEHGQVKTVARPGELSVPFPWLTVGLLAAGAVVLAAAGWFVLRRRRGQQH